MLHHVIVYFREASCCSCSCRRDPHGSWRADAGWRLAAGSQLALRNECNWFGEVTDTGDVVSVTVCHSVSQCVTVAPRAVFCPAVHCPSLKAADLPGGGGLPWGITAHRHVSARRRSLSWTGPGLAPPPPPSRREQVFRARSFGDFRRPEHCHFFVSFSYSRPFVKFSLAFCIYFHSQI